MRIEPIERNNILPAQRSHEGCRGSFTLIQAALRSGRDTSGLTCLICLLYRVAGVVLDRGCCHCPLLLDRRRGVGRGLLHGLDGLVGRILQVVLHLAGDVGELLFHWFGEFTGFLLESLGGLLFGTCRWEQAADEPTACECDETGSQK